MSSKPAQRNIERKSTLSRPIDFRSQTHFVTFGKKCRDFHPARPKMVKKPTEDRFHVLGQLARNTVEWPEKHGSRAIVRRQMVLAQPRCGTLEGPSATLLLSIQVSEALFWHGGQISLFPPGVETIVDHEPRKFRQGPSSDSSRHRKEPCVAEHDSGKLHRQSLGPRQLSPDGDFFPPRQQLRVQIDLHRTDVTAGTA